MTFPMFGSAAKKAKIGAQVHLRFLTLKTHRDRAQSLSLSYRLHHDPGVAVVT